MRKEGGAQRRLFLFWTLLFLIAFFLLRDPTLCAKLVQKGVTVVLKGALPSVFPFLVLSSLFFESGFPLLFQGGIAHFFGRLFHLPDVCISGLAVGLFAGFPLGASFAAGLFEGGLCTKEEAERLSALSGFCAPPFLLGAFGQGVMGDLRAGLLLYAVQTAVVFLYGIILGRLARKKERREALFLKKECGRVSLPAPALCGKPVPALFPMVGSCIGKGALQMVRIGGFILVFYLLSGLILELFSPIFLRFPLLEAPVAGFFEISSGVAHMKAEGTLGMLIGGLCLSFSGVSVHMQVAGYLSSSGLSSKAHFLAHLRLCPIIALVSAFFWALSDFF